MLSAARLRKFGLKLASHYKPAENESKVRRTVRSMFGEQNIRPVRNGVKRLATEPGVKDIYICS